MPAALSFHIGLNSFDPAHYGEPGTLAGCENDARDMTRLAKSRKFTQLTPKPLLTKQATAVNVVKGIKAAAAKLKAGDIFFITYAGHGSQIRDTNGDEAEGMDETWCLYDRMLVDDELAALWATFKPGVRILMLSDSCHSGSVSRAGGPGAAAMVAPSRGKRYRFFPINRALKVYRAHQAVYDAIQSGTRAGKKLDISASVMLISGCQDNQFSADGDENGLFTETLMDVWADGGFTGDYRAFRNKIASFMPPVQQPRYSLVGASNAAFEREQPFTISSSRGSTAKPRTRSTDSPAEFILTELRATGMHNAALSSSTKKWFKEIEKVDTNLGLPMTRTDLFVAHCLDRFPGVPLGKSQLLSGAFATAGDIVEHFTA